MIKVLLIGTDINAYSMARSYHEIYNKKVDVIGYEAMRFTENSKIMNFTYNNNLKNKKEFANILIEYAKENYDEKVLLVPCHDIYVRLVVENREKLEPYYKFNCPSYEIVDSFLVKETFYKKYKNIGVDFPKTYFYSIKNKLNIPDDFRYPLILKPSNGIEYYKHPFSGQAKVYKTHDLQETTAVINSIKNAGYKDNIIIQECIEGDDSTLFDCVFYCNSKGKAELATFAQIGLQEHGPTAIGNCTVLINVYNQFGNTDIIVNKLKKFLEGINYTGFAEFDLKYDLRDKKFKVLEINPRQARSSYYLTATGNNMIKLLIDDLFYNKEKEFNIEKKELLLSMVPKKVILEQIKNKDYKDKALELLKKGKFVDSLTYSKDKSIKRFIYLILRKYNYIKKYRKFNW